MSALLIVPPLPVVGISCSRGIAPQNMLTDDPKEVWADDAVGPQAVAFLVDLGTPQLIDTVFLGAVRPPVAEAQWTVTGGLSEVSQTIVIRDWSPLRVPDVPGWAPLTSCALWFGTAVTARFLRIQIVQPTGAPLSIGRVVIGRAFTPALGHEWGGGRRPIDLGVASPLSSGGFGVVEGARKRSMGWTFGDLTRDETDQLDMIALAHGDTKPLLIVDDPRPTPSLWLRTMYGKFERWRPFERRNHAQTRWELGFEEWR